MSDGRAAVVTVVLFFSLLAAAGAIPACAENMKQKEETGADKMTEKRLRMVDTQIRNRGVKDARVLKAMEEVPRHLFVPKGAVNQAYEDHPLFIGNGQTISQPYIVALMSEVLELKPDDRVLEIGTGSGYQAAVLSVLVKEVYSIEIIPELGESARDRLAALGYDNVEILIGDGYRGWPEKAPFDAVLVTAAPETVPQALVDQMKDGGRMVLPVGALHQELVLLRKKDGKIKREYITAVRFVPMVHGDEVEPEKE